MEQFTIVSNDRIGVLADIAGILGQARINIELLHAEASDGRAAIMLTVSDALRARELLAPRFELNVEQVAEAKNPIHFHPLAMQTREEGAARMGVL